MLSSLKLSIYFGFEGMLGHTRREGTGSWGQLFMALNTSLIGLNFFLCAVGS